MSTFCETDGLGQGPELYPQLCPLLALKRARGARGQLGTSTPDPGARSTREDEGRGGTNRRGQAWLQRSAGRKPQMSLW